VGWPKTSGSRGIHIYLRILPDHGFTQVRRAALAFAREVERRVPDLVTTKWWKEERGEQIFIDFNQNARDRTIASAYSIRASTGLVSAPITWDELPDVQMADFTMATMPARFAALGDVHAGIDDSAFDIGELLEWSERDERDHGQGDAPYPPNFPKMEGEPPRVQPSKINKANWTAEDEPQPLD
jgi:DNA primase